MNPGGDISPGGLTSFVFPYLGNSLPEVQDVGRRKVIPHVRRGLCIIFMGRKIEIFIGHAQEGTIENLNL